MTANLRAPVLPPATVQKVGEYESDRDEAGGSAGDRGENRLKDRGFDEA
jgi:hypothetical protein